MKLQITFCLASSLLTGLLSAQSEHPYLNWVRQLQFEIDENGNSVEIVRDNYVDSRGEDESLLGIPEQGALFQLWTIKTDTGETWLLDTATVGAYLPTAEIIIDAEDSYAGQPRTRADRPFSVTYQYGGLENDESLPLAARQILLVQQAENTGEQSASSGGNNGISDNSGNNGNANSNSNSNSNGNRNSSSNAATEAANAATNAGITRANDAANAATEAANAATNAGITRANDAANAATEAANAATNVGTTLANDAHNTAVEAANAARNAANNSVNFNNPDPNNNSHNSDNFGSSTDAVSSAVELVYQEVKTANGEEIREYASTNITAADPNQALNVKGVERFAVESFSENEDFRYLDQAELQVYPVPSGSITGLVDGEQYRAVPTDISYEVTNAYPGSEIYLEVVQMSSQNTELPDTLATVQDTHWNVPNDQEHDRALPVSNFGDYVSVSSTTFRTRLISKSIFGTEILSETTNFFQNDIAVRGSVYSLD